MYKSEHFPQTQLLSAVSTGIAVIWDDDSPGHKPHLVTFGCYGEINYHGNTTTVFDDGTMVQAVPGAYPGSLFFGPNLHREQPQQPNRPDDSFRPPQTDPSLPSSSSSSSTTKTDSGLLTFSHPLVIATVIVGTLVGILIFRTRGRTNRYGRYRPWGRPNRLFYSGLVNGGTSTTPDETGIGAHSTGVQYVELSTSPSHSIETV